MIDFKEIGSRVAAEIFKEIQIMIRPGLNVLDIESFIRHKIESNGLKAFTVGFKGSDNEHEDSPYPAASCISINNQVAHQIPEDRLLVANDLVKVDIVIQEGEGPDAKLTDVARSFVCKPQGSNGARRKRLINNAYKIYKAGLKQCKAGARLFDICSAMHKEASKLGVQAYNLIGHTIIADKLHNAPYNGPSYECTLYHAFGLQDNPERLQVGQRFTIEPHIRWDCCELTTLELAEDGWAYIEPMGPRIYSAQFENTLVIGADGKVEVLTDFV